MFRSQHFICGIALLWWLQPVVAQPSSAPPDGLPQTTEIETVEPTNKGLLLQSFLQENPAAREHKIGLISEAFIEDKSNPALRLDRVWIGSTGTLLEITGLAREGRPESAIVSFSTIRLVDSKGVEHVPIKFDGVGELRDKRGGFALVVRPGDVWYLLAPPIDDYRAFSMAYLGSDFRPAKYFDRVDPRFKERYSALAALASSPSATPAQMKDFLVEFANNDPDKNAPKVFLALINAMRAQNTFEGFYTAYLLIQDPNDAKAALKLVKDNSQRAKIENMAVATLVDKSRLLEMNFKISGSDIETREGRCWYLCRYNFTANQRISAVLTVKAKEKDSPIKLRVGSYKVTFKIAFAQPRMLQRRSGILGNADARSDYTNTIPVTLTLSPPNYAATVNVPLGAVDIAFFERGSAGGYTAVWSDGNSQATAAFSSIELIQ